MIERETETTYLVAVPKDRAGEGGAIVEVTDKRQYLNDVADWPEDFHQWPPEKIDRAFDTHCRAIAANTFVFSTSDRDAAEEKLAQFTAAAVTRARIRGVSPEDPEYYALQDELRYFAETENDDVQTPSREELPARQNALAAPAEPPPDTYWIDGDHLAQTLVIAGQPAATVYPALNRAEIHPTRHRAAQTIAAPWSVSPFALVEQHFDFERVRIIPSRQDEDPRARVKEGNENFRSFVSRDEEARRSLTDAITALQSHARASEPDTRQREAQMQLELAVHDIDANKGRWTDSARLRVSSAMTYLQPASPQSPQWHAWLECERAVTAERLFSRTAPSMQVEQPAPETEQAFDVFERRGQNRGRGIGPETE